MLVLFINVDIDNGFPSFLNEENTEIFQNNFQFGTIKEDHSIIANELNYNVEDVCAILLPDTINVLPEQVSDFLTPEIFLNICYHKRTEENNRGLFTNYTNKYEITASHTTVSIYAKFADWLCNSAAMNDIDTLNDIIEIFFPAKLEMVLEYLHKIIANDDCIDSINKKLGDAGIQTTIPSENNPTYEQLYNHLFNQL